VPLLKRVPPEIIDAARALPPTVEILGAGVRAKVRPVAQRLFADLLATIDQLGDTEEAPAACVLRMLLAGVFTKPQLVGRVTLADAQDWAGLLTRVQEECAPRGCEDGRRRRRRGHRARKYFEWGAYSKGAQVLRHRSPAIGSVDVREQLAGLFPTEPDAAPDGAADPWWRLPAMEAGPSRIRRDWEEAAKERANRGSRGGDTPPMQWADAVLKAVKQTGRFSAHGPCGLRREHVLALIGNGTAPGAPELLHLWGEVVDHALAGRLTGAYMTDLTLVGIPKATGGVRPVGIGNLIRRTAAKMAARVVAGEVRGRLEASLQFGLSDSGAGRVFDVVSTGLLRDGEHVVQLDINNAFNSINRRVILEEMAAASPAAAIVRTLYGGPSRAYVRGAEGRPIECTRGVVQGCPLAPVLFALAFDRVRRTAKAAFGEQPLRSPPLTMAMYADDVHLTSQALPDLERMVACLEEAAKDCGLSFSWNRRIDHETVVAGKCRLLLAEDVHVPLGALEDKLLVTDQLVVLGIPLVRRSHPHRADLIKTAWETYADECVARVALLREIGEPQWMVRCTELAGAWSRIQYKVGLAAAEDDIPGETLRRLEEADRDVLALALGPHGGQLGHCEWAWACLPRDHGGLGIRSVSVEATMARQWQPRVIAALNGRHADTPADVRFAADHTRKRVYTILAQNVRDSLCTRRLAVMQAGAGLGGRTWTAAAASSAAKTLMRRDHAHVAFALSLGLRVFPGDTVCTREGTRCRADAINARQEAPSAAAEDVYGHHHASCVRVTKLRHNAIRDQLYSMARTYLPREHVKLEAGCDPRGMPRMGDGGAREGDVCVFLPRVGHWTFVDVRVAGLPAADADLLRYKLLDQGRLAKKATDDKAGMPGAENVRDRGASFVPFGVSAFGGFGKKATAFVNSIAAEMDKRDASNQPAEPFCPTAIRLLQRLSFECIAAWASSVCESDNYAYCNASAVGGEDGPALDADGCLSGAWAAPHDALGTDEAASAALGRHLQHPPADAGDAAPALAAFEACWYGGGAFDLQAREPAPGARCLEAWAVGDDVSCASHGSSVRARNLSPRRDGGGQGMLRTPAGRVGNDCIGGAGAGAAPAAWGKVVASARVASHTAAPRHSTGSAQPAESPAPPRGRVHAWTRSPLRAPPRSPCVAPDVVHRNVILWEACTRFVGGTGQLSAGAFDVLRLVRGVAEAMHAASHSDAVHPWSPHWPPWDAAVQEAVRALERYCARPQLMIVRADATAPGAALLDAHAGRRTLATAVFGKALSDRRVLAGVLGLPISVRGGTARNLLRGRDQYHTALVTLDRTFQAMRDTPTDSDPWTADAHADLQRARSLWVGVTPAAQLPQYVQPARLAAGSPAAPGPRLAPSSPQTPSTVVGLTSMRDRLTNDSPRQPSLQPRPDGAASHLGVRLDALNHTSLVVAEAWTASDEGSGMAAAAAGAAVSLLSRGRADRAHATRQCHVWSATGGGGAAMSPALRVVGSDSDGESHSRAFGAPTHLAGRTPVPITSDNGLSAYDGYDVLADEGARGLPLVTGGEVGSGEGAFVAPASGDGSEGELEVGGG